MNVNGKSVRNGLNSRETIMKVLLKTFMNFSSLIFQISGLRKMNIANAESLFDQNEYDILTLQ